MGWRCYIIGNFLHLLLWAGAAGAAGAYPSCRILGDYSALKNLSADQIGKVRSEFKHDSRYDKVVNSGPIGNQGGWGGCWAFSLSTVFQGILKNRTNQKVDLNPQFLIAMQVATRALGDIEKYGKLHRQGEHLGYALALVRSYGLVPKNVWRPKVDITQREVGARFHFFVNVLVEKYQIAIKDVDDQIAAIQSKRRTLSARDQASVADLKTARREIIRNAKAEIMELITSFLGPLPENFKFRGKIFTPVEFANEYFDVNNAGILNLVLEVDRRETPPGWYPTRPREHIPRKNILEAKFSAEDIERVIVKEIDNGRPVWLCLNWEAAFINSATGIMSLNAFHSPFSEVAMDRRYRDVFASSYVHAVVIVGYKKGPDGRVLRFKVHNSWGRGLGDGGIYHMYRDYFEAFARSAAFVLPSDTLERLRPRGTKLKIERILRSF